MSRRKAAKRSAVGVRPGGASFEAYGERFDRSPYELPTMDLGEAIALATALLEAKSRPTPALAEETSRLAAARDRARAMQARQARQASQAANDLDARPFDVAMDRAWATFVRRIEDVSALPAARYPEAVEAARVLALVGDLSILKLNYLAEFAQIGARLDGLKREGWLDAARRFAGPQFLDEVLRCHAAYGEALGVGDRLGAEEAAPDRGLARLELVETIAEYAVQVLSLARAGRPSTWKAVQGALAPIAEVHERARQESRAMRAEREPPAHPV